MDTFKVTSTDTLQSYLQAHPFSPCPGPGAWWDIEVAHPLATYATQTQVMFE